MVSRNISRVGGRRFLRSRRQIAVTIGALVFCVVIALRFAGFLQAFELATYDRFLRLRPPLSSAASAIVLIRISEEDIRRFGYPVSDALLTSVLDRLLAAGPRAIGVDLYRDAPVPQVYHGFEIGHRPSPDYLELGETVTATDRVVMVMKFPGHSGAATSAPRWLDGSAPVGFSDIPVDPGGIVRRGLLYLWDDETAHLSLALQLAARYLRAEGIGIQSDPANPDYVRIGPTTVPPLQANEGGYVRSDDRGYQFLLDYRFDSESLPSFSLRDVLSNAVPSAVVRDKVVIVGTTAASVKDHFYTPHSQARRRRQEMFGIGLHAQAVSQLIRFGRGESRPISTLTEFGEFSWILLWSLLGAALGLWKRAAGWSALAALAGLGLLVFAGYALMMRDWWIPIVPPALAGVGSAGLVTAYIVAHERSERRQVTRLFSRFLRPQVAQEIWRQRDQFMRGDQPWRPRSRWVTLTTLMLDLEGYTTASEQTDAYALMDWVNEFTSVMAEIVDQYGGVVDDYAGDGIKANFGFPVPSSQDQIRADAANATRCALAMGRAMEALNAEWGKRELPLGRLRMGICTGPAVVGVLGGDQSLKYTSVGDTVNTASRLESFDKDGFASDTAAGAWRILVAEETLRRLQGNFRAIDLGLHVLKGKQEPIRVYRILAPLLADDPVEEHER